MSRIAVISKYKYISNANISLTLFDHIFVDILLLHDGYDTKTNILHCMSTNRLISSFYSPFLELIIWI